MPTFARHSLTIKSGLFLVTLLSVAFIFFVAPLVFSNYERMYSSELGYTAFSPNGEEGGGIIPASCESNPVVAHEIPIYSNTETPYIIGYETESLAGCPGATVVSPGEIRGLQCLTQDWVSHQGVVTLNGGSPKNSSPYAFSNLTPGNYTVAITPPSFYTVRGYTMCTNATNCHTNIPTSGSSVSVNVPSGGYVDLWWHCSPPPPNADIVASYPIGSPNSNGPVTIGYGDSLALGWDARPYADSCTLNSSPNVGSWYGKTGGEGIKDPNAYGPTVSLTQNTSFTLSCQNTTASRSDSLSVNVCTQSQRLFNGACQTCLTPVINGPTSIGGTLGKFFLQQYTVSNVNPTFISQSGTRPPGVNFENNTGLLSGTPTSAGDFNITLSAVNSCGTNATKSVAIKICGTGFTHNSVTGQCVPDNQCSAEAGKSCTSPANYCGQTASGTLQCNGTSCSASTPSNSSCPVCNNNVDDDGDGLKDYPNDPGCSSITDTDEKDPVVPTTQSPQCSNSIDDDGDGRIDYPNDLGCTSTTDNDETDPVVPTVAQCRNGIDDDTDGKIDCRTGNQDPGCYPNGKGGGGACNPNDNSEYTPQCSDGLDNDGDSLIDYPNDTGCSSLTDNTEQNSINGRDLIVTLPPRLVSGTLRQGSDLRFEGLVRNQGNVSTSITFNNLFQIDVGNNGSYDNNLSFSDGTYPRITGISGNQNRSVTSPYWRNVPVGTHAIRLCADLPPQSSGLVTELNENNNCGPNFLFTIDPLNQCSDGIDNDDDDRIDCQTGNSDPGCYPNGRFVAGQCNPNDNNESDDAPQCSDGLDNDNDGKIDYPDDPGCTGPTDDNETDTTPPVEDLCPDQGIQTTLPCPGGSGGGDLCPDPGTQTTLPCPGGGGGNPPGGGGSCVFNEGEACESAFNSCGMEGTIGCDGRCIPPPDDWCDVDIEFHDEEEDTRQGELLRRGGNCTIEWTANNVQSCTLTGPLNFYCPSSGAIGRSCSFNSPGESRRVTGSVTISSLLQTAQFVLDCRNNEQSYESKVFACRINPTFIEI